MKEISSQISHFLEVIEEYVEAIINQSNTETKKMKLFTEEMLLVLPKIISLYTRPEFNEMSGDMQYWTGQTKQIMEALEKDDKFWIIDTLKYETCVNLRLFQKIIDGME